MFIKIGNFGLIIIVILEIKKKSTITLFDFSFYNITYLIDSVYYFYVLIYSYLHRS